MSKYHPRIGLTGKIACGKSTVSEYMHSLGFKIIDCDKLGHQVLRQQGVKTALRDYFGSHIFEHGEVCRPVLGRVVFHDTAARRQLEKIVRPRLHKEIFKNLFEDISQVVDCFDLIGTAVQPLLDETWLVVCDPEKQLKRLMARNHFEREEAMSRIKAHPMSDKEMMAGADVILHNSGRKSKLLAQVDENLQRLHLI